MFVTLYIQLDWLLSYVMKMKYTYMLQFSFFLSYFTAWNCYTPFNYFEYLHLSNYDLWGITFIYFIFLRLRMYLLHTIPETQKWTQEKNIWNNGLKCKVGEANKDKGLSYFERPSHQTKPEEPPKWVKYECVTKILDKQKRRSVKTSKRFSPSAVLNLTVDSFKGTSIPVTLENVSNTKMLRDS